MMLPIAGLISLIASVVILVEIVILCILYQKLSKKRKAVTFLRFLIIATEPLFLFSLGIQSPVWISSLIILIGKDFTVCCFLRISYVIVDSRQKQMRQEI